MRLHLDAVMNRVTAIDLYARLKGREVSTVLCDAAGFIAHVELARSFVG